MITIENDNCLFVDIDDTLILWDKPEDYDIHKALKTSNGTMIYPHWGHIDYIKRFSARGQIVFVWSQGGFNWAEEIVKLTGLEDHIFMVMCKPKWFMDDLPASGFMPESNRIYYKEWYNGIPKNRL